MLFNKCIQYSYDEGSEVQEFVYFYYLGDLKSR